MPRKSFDPLLCVPSPDVIRDKLRETLTLAERLRILLDLSERLRLPVVTADTLVPAADRQGVARG
jgi:hypothetical protein